MPYMVQMVMCDKHCAEGIKRKAVGLQGLFQPSETHPGIYEYTVFLISEIIAVAAASA